MTNRRRPAPPALADTDRELFRNALDGITPMQHNTSDARVTPPPPRAHMRRRDEIEVRAQLLKPMDDDLEVELGEPLAYVKEGHPRTLLKALGKGQYAVREMIDLHQMTAEVAKQAIDLFLADAKSLRHTCVKIIHGKGLRSKPGGPILKKLVDRQLRLRGDVIAFRSARPNDGGTGAVIVLLKV